MTAVWVFFGIYLLTGFIMGIRYINSRATQKNNFNLNGDDYFHLFCITIGWPLYLVLVLVAFIIHSIMLVVENMLAGTENYKRRL